MRETAYLYNPKHRPMVCVVTEDVFGKTVELAGVVYTIFRYGDGQAYNEAMKTYIMDDMVNYDTALHSPELRLFYQKQMDKYYTTKIIPTKRKNRPLTMGLIRSMTK